MNHKFKSGTTRNHQGVLRRSVTLVKLGICKGNDPVSILESCRTKKYGTFCSFRQSGKDSFNIFNFPPSQTDTEQHNSDINQKKCFLGQTYSQRVGCVPSRQWDNVQHTAYLSLPLQIPRDCATLPRFPQSLWHVIVENDFFFLFALHTWDFKEDFFLALITALNAHPSSSLNYADFGSEFSLHSKAPNRAPHLWSFSLWSSGASCRCNPHKHFCPWPQVCRHPSQSHVICWWPPIEYFHSPCYCTKSLHYPIELCGYFRTQS